MARIRQMHWKIIDFVEKLIQEEKSKFWKIDCDMIQQHIYVCSPARTSVLASAYRLVMLWLKSRDLPVLELINGLHKTGLLSVIEFHILHNNCALELTFPLQEKKLLNVHTRSCILLKDLKPIMKCPKYLLCCCREIHSWNLSPLSLRRTHLEDCLLSLDVLLMMNCIDCLFGTVSGITLAEFDYYFEVESILTNFLLLISKSKVHEMRSSVFNEQKDVLLKVERKPGQLGSSVHHSSFLEITKNVVCFLSNILAVILFHRTLNMLSICMLKKSNDVVNVSKIGKLGNDRPFLCLNAPKGVEKCSAIETLALFNERKSREQQLRNHVEVFFMNKTSIINHEEEKGNGENQTEEMKQMDEENVKSIDDGKCDEAVEDGKDRSENQGLINVIPEIFRFVEVRSGTDIVACPAAQQQVLDPFLNRFSSPNNKPSKHDTMAMEFLRLCSMHDYPSKQGPSLLRLAEAGFYYEGNGEELICFSCGVRNRVWSYNESPNEIHQRLSPGCKFLTSDGDGNVPVPRNLPTEELASNRTGMVETDGLSNSDSASAREPANNTAHLSSASYSPLRSESPPRVMAVKHPEYSARSARLGSYQTFPRHMKQHPADMTDAGFYYAGFGDCCRCFHCGIGLRNWDPEDNPWIEHARWSAECPYILQMKGQAFIDLVQEAARAAEMADSDGDNEADSTSASTQEKSAMNEKSGADNFPPKAPAGNSNYEVENNVAKTSEAEISKGTLEDGGSSAGHNVEAKPIKAPLRTAAAQSLIHDENIKPKYVTAAIEELVNTEGWGAFSLENIRKYLKIQEDGRKSASSASNADPSVLKQENKELKDLTICKICLDEKVSIVFLPCGHLVSCPQCAPALTKCPICRKGIKGTVRTNLVEKNTVKSGPFDKTNPKASAKKT